MLTFSARTVKVGSNPIVAVPLREVGRWAEFWENIPSRCNEAIRWATAAKSPVTRARRVKKAVAAFLHGPYRSQR